MIILEHDPAVMNAMDWVTITDPNTKVVITKEAFCFVGEEVHLPAYLLKHGLVKSKVEGRRLIKEGAIDICGETTHLVNIILWNGETIRVGKHKTHIVGGLKEIITLK